MNPQTIQPIQAVDQNKQALVVEALVEMAGKLGVGAKLPTARELASALGVTRATLSRCLEQLERRRILRCRQGSGIYVDVGTMQKRIAVVFGGNIFSPAGSQFGSLIIQHCSRQASIHKQHFSFFIDTPAFNGVMDGEKVPVHQDLAHALADGRIDGIILMGRSSGEQDRWLRQQGVPVVEVGGVIEDLREDFPTVSLDYQKMMELGVKRLRDSGCRTFGLLGIIPEHREMFQKALQEAGLASKDEWMVCSSVKEYGSFGDTHERRGSECAETFIANCQNGKALPDGILITDDVMAKGVLSSLSNSGIAIGENLAVCSHANKGAFTLQDWESKILKVEFDPQALAAALFDVLELLMAGESPSMPHLVSPLIELTA